MFKVDGVETKEREINILLNKMRHAYICFIIYIYIKKKKEEEKFNKKKKKKKKIQTNDMHNMYIHTFRSSLGK
jgi:predicted membrane protein